VSVITSGVVSIYLVNECVVNKGMYSNQGNVYKQGMNNKQRKVVQAAYAKRVESLNFSK